VQTPAGAQGFRSISYGVRPAVCSRAYAEASFHILFLAYTMSLDLTGITLSVAVRVGVMRECAGLAQGVFAPRGMGKARPLRVGKRMPWAALMQGFNVNQSVGDSPLVAERLEDQTNSLAIAVESVFFFRWPQGQGVQPNAARISPCRFATLCHPVGRRSKL
jgi:hypothetical protein